METIIEIAILTANTSISLNKVLLGRQILLCQRLVSPYKSPPEIRQIRPPGLLHISQIYVADSEEAEEEQAMPDSSIVISLVDHGPRARLIKLRNMSPSLPKKKMTITK